MIKTQSYNDFSSFSYEQKHDYTFMLEQIKTFKQNGGDISLLVKESTSNENGQIELLTFKDYIIRNIDNYNEFFSDLLKDDLMPGLCDFKWNLETGEITEKMDYGISWMNENYHNFKGAIDSSIKKLLSELPKDLSKIVIFNELNKNGSAASRKLHHPLYTIANTINQNDVYQLIFDTFPELKNYWNEPSRVTKEARFLYVLDISHFGVGKPKTAICFYKNGIGTDYFHKPENLDNLHELILHASEKGDTEFLKLALPKIDLNKIELEKYSRNLSLCKAKNKEVAQILIDHNAVIEKEIDTPSGKLINNVVLNEEITKIEVIDLIMQRLPQYREEIKIDSKSYYRMLESRDFEVTKLLVEKYEFPLENFDMLYLAYKKSDSDDFQNYKWLLQHGADIRECDQLCYELVKEREAGLKLIRALNKEGIIVSKSPDFVFNIFQNSPTKTFLNYYDKLTYNELEKTTKNGLPAWWGAKHNSDYSFMFSRIKNHDQLAQDGKNLLFYLLESEIKHKGLQPKEIIKLQLKKIKVKNPDYKLDLSYEDKNGNNFLHHLLTFERYYKSINNLDLLEILAENSIQNPYVFLSKENKVGISPMDLFLTQDNSGNYEYSKVLETFLEKSPKEINFTKELSTGKTVGEYFLDNFTLYPEKKAFVETLILEQELSVKSINKGKKMKL